MDILELLLSQFNKLSKKEGLVSSEMYDEAKLNLVRKYITWHHIEIFKKLVPDYKCSCGKCIVESKINIENTYNNNKVHSCECELVSKIAKFHLQRAKNLIDHWKFLKKLSSSRNAKQHNSILSLTGKNVNDEDKCGCNYYYYDDGDVLPANKPLSNICKNVERGDINSTATIEADKINDLLFSKEGFYNLDLTYEKELYVKEKEEEVSFGNKSFTTDNDPYYFKGRIPWLYHIDGEEGIHRNYFSYDCCFDEYCVSKNEIDKTIKLLRETEKEIEGRSKDDNSKDDEIDDNKKKDSDEEDFSDRIEKKNKDVCLFCEFPTCKDNRFDNGDLTREDYYCYGFHFDKEVIGSNISTPTEATFDAYVDKYLYDYEEVLLALQALYDYPAQPLLPLGGENGVNFRQKIASGHRHVINKKGLKNSTAANESTTYDMLDFSVDVRIARLMLSQTAGEPQSDIKVALIKKVKNEAAASAQPSFQKELLKTPLTSQKNDNINVKQTNCSDVVILVGYSHDQTNTMESKRQALLRGYYAYLNKLQRPNFPPQSPSACFHNYSVNADDLLYTCGPAVTNYIIKCDNSERVSMSQIDDFIALCADYYSPYRLIGLQYSHNDYLTRQVPNYDISNGSSESDKEEEEIKLELNKFNKKSNSFNADSSFNLHDKYVSAVDLPGYELYYIEQVAMLCCENIIEFSSTGESATALCDWLLMRHMKYLSKKDLGTSNENNNSNVKIDNKISIKSDISNVKSIFSDTKDYIDSFIKINRNYYKFPAESTFSQNQAFRQRQTRLLPLYVYMQLITNSIPLSDARKDKCLMQKAIDEYNKKSMLKYNDINDNKDSFINDNKNSSYFELRCARSSRASSYKEAVEILSKSPWSCINSCDNENNNEKSQSPVSPFPIVIKPINGAGSEFVSLCYNWEELHAAFTVSLGAETVISRKASVMCLQEYLGGGGYNYNMSFLNNTKALSTYINSALKMNMMNRISAVNEEKPVILSDSNKLNNNNYFGTIVIDKDTFTGINDNINGTLLSRLSNEYVVDTVSYNGQHVFTDIWTSRKFPTRVYSNRLRTYVVSAIVNKHKKNKRKIEKNKENKFEKVNEINKTVDNSKNDISININDEEDDDDAYDVDGNRKSFMTTTFNYDYQDLILPLNKDSSDNNFDPEVLIVIEYTLRVLDALQVSNGPAHSEVMVTYQIVNSSSANNTITLVPVPKLIELNPRMQGDIPRATHIIGYDQISLMTHILSFRRGLWTSKLQSFADSNCSSFLLNSDNQAQLQQQHGDQKEKKKERVFSSLVNCFWPPQGILPYYGYEKYITYGQRMVTNYSADNSTTASLLFGQQKLMNNNSFKRNTFDHLQQNQPLVPFIVEPYSYPPYVPTSRYLRLTATAAEATIEKTHVAIDNDNIHSKINLKKFISKVLFFNKVDNNNDNNDNNYNIIEQKQLQKFKHLEHEILINEIKRLIKLYDGGTGLPFLFRNSDCSNRSLTYDPVYRLPYCLLKRNKEYDTFNKDTETNKDSNKASTISKLTCFHEGLFYDPTRILRILKYFAEIINHNTNSSNEVINNNKSDKNFSYSQFDSSTSTVSTMQNPQLLSQIKFNYNDYWCEDLAESILTGDCIESESGRLLNSLFDEKSYNISKSSSSLAIKWRNTRFWTLQQPISEDNFANSTVSYRSVVGEEMKKCDSRHFKFVFDNTSNVKNKIGDQDALWDSLINYLNFGQDYCCCNDFNSNTSNINKADNSNNCIYFSPLYTFFGKFMYLLKDYINEKTNKNYIENSNYHPNNLDIVGQEPFVMRIVFLFVSDNGLLNNNARLFIRDQLPCFVRFTRSGEFVRGISRGFLMNVDKTTDIFSSPAAIILFGPKSLVEASYQCIRYMEDCAQLALSRKVIYSPISNSTNAYNNINNNDITLFINNNRLESMFSTRLPHHGICKQVQSQPFDQNDKIQEKVHGCERNKQQQPQSVVPNLWDTFIKIKENILPQLFIYAEDVKKHLSSYSSISFSSLVKSFSASSSSLPSLLSLFDSLKNDDSLFDYMTNHHHFNLSFILDGPIKLLIASDLLGDIGGFYDNLNDKICDKRRNNYNFNSLYVYNVSEMLGANLLESFLTSDGQEVSSSVLSPFLRIIPANHSSSLEDHGNDIEKDDDENITKTIIPVIEDTERPDLDRACNSALIHVLSPAALVADSNSSKALSSPSFSLLTSSLANLFYKAKAATFTRIIYSNTVYPQLFFTYIFAINLLNEVKELYSSNTHLFSSIKVHSGNNYNISDKGKTGSTSTTIDNSIYLSFSSFYPRARSQVQLLTTKLREEEQNVHDKVDLKGENDNFTVNEELRQSIDDVSRRKNVEARNFDIDKELIFNLFQLMDSRFWDDEKAVIRSVINSRNGDNISDHSESKESKQNDKNIDDDVSNREDHEDDEEDENNNCDTSSHIDDDHEKKKPDGMFMRKFVIMDVIDKIEKIVKFLICTLSKAIVTAYTIHGRINDVIVPAMAQRECVAWCCCAEKFREFLVLIMNNDDKNNYDLTSLEAFLYSVSSTAAAVSALTDNNVNSNNMHIGLRYIIDLCSKNLLCILHAYYKFIAEVYNFFLSLKKDDNICYNDLKSISELKKVITIYFDDYYSILGSVATFCEAFFKDIIPKGSSIRDIDDSVVSNNNSNKKMDISFSSSYALLMSHKSNVLNKMFSSFKNVVSICKKIDNFTKIVFDNYAIVINMAKDSLINLSNKIIESLKSRIKLQSNNIGADIYIPYNYNSNNGGGSHYYNKDTFNSCHPSGMFTIKSSFDDVNKDKIDLKGKNDHHIKGDVNSSNAITIEDITKSLTLIELGLMYSPYLHNISFGAAVSIFNEIYKCYEGDDKNIVKSVLSSFSCRSSIMAYYRLIKVDISESLPQQRQHKIIDEKNKNLESIRDEKGFASLERQMQLQKMQKLEMLGSTNDASTIEEDFTVVVDCETSTDVNMIKTSTIETKYLIYDDLFTTLNKALNVSECSLIPPPFYIHLNLFKLMRGISVAIILVNKMINEK